MPGPGPAPNAAVATATKQPTPTARPSRIRLRISASLEDFCCNYTRRGRKGPSGGLRQRRMDLTGQRRDLLRQFLVLARQRRVRLEQCRELVRFRLDRGDAALARLLLALTMLLGELCRRLVPGRLACLREEDQRRGVRSLRREREVEEDER